MKNTLVVILLLAIAVALIGDSIPVFMNEAISSRHKFEFGVGVLACIYGWIMIFQAVADYFKNKK